MRLIDADAIRYKDLNADMPNSNIHVWVTFLDWIKRMPTVEGRKTGTWLRYGEDGNPNEEDTVFWQCDQCLESYTGRTTRIPNYCPNCGAKMEE